MAKTFGKALLIFVLIVCFAAFTAIVFAQKKVGGGDLKYEGKPGMPGPVVFSHEVHVTQHKAKCADCHPKIFPKMKKDANGITQASFKEGKFCGACHDGKKAFSATAQSDCNKCHKK